MPVISMKKLLEVGVHFGHQTKRWNPKMAPYIFTSRNGIYIIDLKKSSDKLDEAYQAMKEIAEKGGKVLFVGTKKQAQEAVQTEAERSGSYFVNSRWLGGTLTNFKTIQKRIKRLIELEKMEEDGSLEQYTKKEAVLLMKEKAKLERNLGGIKEMKKLPNALFVVDPKVEHNAVAEAKILGIPVFGIVDTNCDPDEVDYVIPGNDDAVRSVKLMLGVLTNAIAEVNGNEMIDFLTEEDKAKAEKKAKKQEIKEEIKEVKENAKEKKEEIKENIKATKKEVKEAAKEVVEDIKDVMKDIKDMTLTELKEVAKIKGIKGYSKLKKDELLEVLK